MEFNSQEVGKSGTLDNVKIKDLLEENHLTKVLNDAKSLGLSATNRFFSNGARKAPITKQTLQRFIGMSSIMGHMQAVEGLMSFLENAEVIDGFDPKHELVQNIYGELCMYLLKLDKILFDNYGIKSSVSHEEIHSRTVEYVDKFYARREKIIKLQEILGQEVSNVTEN